VRSVGQEAARLISSTPIRRIVALAVLPPLLVFVALIGRAMSDYPGGTWEEPKAQGHSQVRNFLCDLTRPIALNGVPNASGARSAELGLLAYAVALIPFFLILPSVFPDRRRTGVLAAVCGVLAGIGGVAIVLVPSHQYGPLLHGVAVLLTAIPGLTAAFAATLGVFTTRTAVRPIRAAALATLLLTAAAVVPVLEKLALACSVGWMLLTVAQASKASSR
jgi:hypothetical protein